MTSRASRQCHYNGCDSEARWRMYVKFVSMTRMGALWPVDAESTVCVCDQHRQKAAESFVGERNMDQLAISLGQENLMCPHPRTIEISFAPVRNGINLANALRFG